MEKKLHIISWSGGKDSTASVILAHENGDPVDLIIMCVVDFDKSRGISGEHPEHIAWVMNYAKPLFENWGYKVVIISPEHDYIHFFYHIITKSKKPERNGKLGGFLLGGMCRMTEQKTDTIHRYISQLTKEREEYVGIAIDEPERLERLNEKKGKVSLLEKYSYTEQMAKDICERYGLLSPIYKISKRGGCWFCPNQKIQEFAYLKKNYPHLWRELEKLDAEPNKCSEGFKYGKTLKQIDAEVEGYTSIELNQISIFDYLEEMQQ